MSLKLKIEEILKDFHPISLDEMDSVKMMNRTDNKFFFRASLLQEILLKAKNKYRVLEINKIRQFNYTSTYFDTPGLFFYYEHINERYNRYKIRQRKYVETGTEFFEVKFKTNKNKTLKSRIENTTSSILNEATEKFLRKKTPFHNGMIIPVLKNDFIRITLVNNALTERATLDFNLSFDKEGKCTDFSGIGIAEVKQDENSGESDLMAILKELGIRPGGISKYCLGVATLVNDVKINSIKPKLNKIKKIQDDFSTNTR